MLLGPDPPHPLWQTHIASVTSAVVSFLGIHSADVSACRELLDVLAVAASLVEDKVGLERCCFCCCVWCSGGGGGGGGGGWLWCWRCVVFFVGAVAAASA
jgi:hypothetical protein